MEFQQGKVADAYWTNLTPRVRSAVQLRRRRSQPLADASLPVYIHQRGDSRLYAQVEMISKRLLQKNAGSYDGLRLKGYIYMLDRHFPEAIETLKKANAVKPQQADLIDALMESLTANGQFPEAEKLGLDLIQRQPAHGPVYDMLYGYYASNKRLSEAEAILKRKVENNPNVLPYRLQLAGHYAAVNNQALMSKTIQEVMDNPSRFPSAFMDVGDFYFSQRRYDDALRIFQTGSKQPDRERKWACQKRAVEVLITQKKWDQAMAGVQEMLKADATRVSIPALSARRLIWTRTNPTRPLPPSRNFATCLSKSPPMRSCTTIWDAPMFRPATAKRLFPSSIRP